MSKNSKTQLKVDSGIVEVKSKFDAEFRRFSVSRNDTAKYEDFRALIERLHRLSDVPFLISYTDPRDGDLLPINNDDNLGCALLNARPLLRVIVQRKDVFCFQFVAWQHDSTGLSILNRNKCRSADS
ncbi:uncharacterized protein GBIM_09911 [Gryllus bimaculatus]|nr:uncharacterized protein GBIM_09911 [Gryllus bimaculatus]